MAALFSDYDAIRRAGLFDEQYYLATYPDVAERNLDPLVHYLEEGAAERRNPNPDFDTAFYLEQCRQRGETPGNPLIHYLRVGMARGFKTKADKGRKTAVDKRAAAGRPKQPPMLLALEALGIAGMTDGSLRFTLSGWALAESPIAEVAVAIGGEAVGSATYGLARPDIAALYPDREAAGRCGFTLGFDLPMPDRGAVDLALTVRTADGETGQRLLGAEIPPRQLPTALVDPLDPRRGRSAAERDDAMRLGIDSAAVDAAGLLRLEGWVVSRARVESVEVFVDGVSIGQAETGRVRSDIEERHPDYPNPRFSGFRLIGQIAGRGAGRKTVLVRSAAGGTLRREASAVIDVPVFAGAAKPAGDAGLQYHCDEAALTPAGHLVLRGWAVCPSAIRSLAVLRDGAEIGRATIGLDRPEIGNLFPILPHARKAGFTFAAELGLAAAEQASFTLRFLRQDRKVHDVAIPVAAGRDRLGGAATADGDGDRKLHLDTPVLLGGAAETPVRGSLEISGWALARSGVAEIEIALDGRTLTTADYGLRRLDIQAAFPDWDNSLASGYQALLPYRALPKGSHSVSVRLRDRRGDTETVEFRIEVEELPDDAGPWSLRRKMPQAEIDLAERILQRRGCTPTFLAILPLGNARRQLPQARATIASLRAQAYPNWRLLVLSGEAEMLGKTLLAGVDADDARIAVVEKLASGDLAGLAGESFVTVLMPGDELGCDAFLELAVASAQHRGADFLYSDERRPNPASGKIEAFFKPQWSPDLLLATNYIGRLWCARADLLRSVIVDNEALLRYGEYDLVLRCTEAAREIRHVAAVLCEHAGPANESPRQAQAALRRAFARRGIDAEPVAGLVGGTQRIERRLKQPGRVSIIVPTCAAKGRIETCLTTLRERTRYPDYEIVCVENIPPKARKWRAWLARHADRVISLDEPFNWSRFNNLAAAAATGEYLLFLNDDVEIVAPDWLDTLLAEAQRPEVGAVGARLLYPDGRVQHAGMFLAAPGQARHAFRYTAGDDPGYFGLSLTQRNVIAVTGACLMTRRDTFQTLGGFDESHGVINNDVDYCLRARQNGLLTVYTPHARLVHYEAVSRAALPDDYDVAAFDTKWRRLYIDGDPFFNPHLSKRHDDFAVDDEPTQLSVIGRPMLSRDAVRNILVVKLDHIGDCITAFPAVRRLKSHFPKARIAVLTSRVAKPVWAFEPVVDRTIEFEFFHARSAMGQVALSEQDWAALRDRLASERFDIAVDLRKHPETREVLQYSGARRVAGFDHRGQFPWLDIALEWGGDQLFARKRQWAGDDLVNLVDAIAAACEPDRAVIAAPAQTGKTEHQAGKAPVVWVHPTAGNDIKQWPLEYFAIVIDQLVETHGAHVFLTGAPADEGAAAAILRLLRHPHAVTSMIGSSPLAKLPALMQGAALFVGNDSGIKHIAAALGIPTVGIHGGTLDPREWGPVGPNAAAVARDMVCSPCYLAKAEDCRREVACLRLLDPARVIAACDRLLLLAQPAARGGDAEVPLRAARSRPRPRTLGPVAPAADLRA